MPVKEREEHFFTWTLRDTNVLTQKPRVLSGFIVHGESFTGRLLDPSE